MASCATAPTLSDYAGMAQQRYQQQAQAAFGTALQGASDNYFMQIDSTNSQLSATDLYSTATIQTTNPWTWYQGGSLAQGVKKMIKFWRVNQVVEIDEGAELTDPLDSLRLHIARWLHKGEQWNLT